jgi:hypothetical protein
VGSNIILCSLTNDEATVGGGVFISSDYGNTLIQQPTLPKNAEWHSVASNATGSVLITCSINNGSQVSSVYVSSDYGNSWIQQTNIPYGTSIDWYYVACDSTGMYLTAVGTSSVIKQLLYRSANGGTTWEHINIPELNTFFVYFRFVAIDPTGKNQAVTAIYNNINSIYTSQDYGVTWNLSKLTNYACCLASNSIGFVAFNYEFQNNTQTIYISKDHGISWTTTSSAYSGACTSVASNFSGSKLIASLKNKIIISSNYGDTWQQLTGLPNIGWTVVAMNYSDYYYAISSSNLYIIFLNGQTPIINIIPIHQNAVPIQWLSTASDTTGRKVIAGSRIGGVFLSENYGTTWTLTNLQLGNWPTVSSDYSGANLIACKEIRSNKLTCHAADSVFHHKTVISI